MSHNHQLETNITFSHDESYVIFGDSHSVYAVSTVDYSKTQLSQINDVR